MASPSPNRLLTSSDPDPEPDPEYLPPRYSFIGRDLEDPSHSTPPSYTTSSPRRLSSQPAQSVSPRPEKQRSPETADSSNSSFLHVRRDAHNRFTVFDSNRALLLFVAELHHPIVFSDKYELRVRSYSAGGPVVGTSTIDAANHTLSLNIHQTPVLIARAGPSFEADEVFDLAPSDGDGNGLRWESRDVAAGEIDLVLQASQSRECLARIDSPVGETEEARVEIRNRSMTTAMFDKAVVSGLAMVMLLKKRKAKKVRYQSRSSPAMRVHLNYISTPN